MSEGHIVPKSKAAMAKSAYDNFIAKLELEASLTETDNSAIVMDVVSNILSAETMEDATKAQGIGLPSAKENMVDVEHAVNDFTVHKGNPAFEENSIGYFFVVDATNLETGEAIRYSVGSSNVLATLWHARDLGQLPFEMVIRSKPTANGALLFVKSLSRRAMKVKAEK